MLLKYQFPAVKGNQAGKEYYICMVPLGLLSKIFISDNAQHKRISYCAQLLGITAPDDNTLRVCASEVKRVKVSSCNDIVVVVV